MLSNKNKLHTAELPNMRNKRQKKEISIRNPFNCSNQTNNLILFANLAIWIKVQK